MARQASSWLHLDNGFISLQGIWNIGTMGKLHPSGLIHKRWNEQEREIFLWDTIREWMTLHHPTNDEGTIFVFLCSSGGEEGAYPWVAGPACCGGNFLLFFTRLSNWKTGAQCLSSSQFPHLSLTLDTQLFGFLSFFLLTYTSIYSALLCLRTLLRSVILS